MDRNDVLKIIEKARQAGEAPDLREADLAGVDLRWENLAGANLSGADLSGANLSGANLRDTNLRNVRGWEGLQITGLHRYQILLAPTPDQWEITIGCWTGTPNDLTTLIAQDDDWPESTGADIPRNRRLLEAALVVIHAHIAARPYAGEKAAAAHQKWENKDTA